MNLDAPFDDEGRAADGDAGVERLKEEGHEDDVAGANGVGWGGDVISDDWSAWLVGLEVQRVWGS